MRKIRLSTTLTYVLIVSLIGICSYLLITHFSFSYTPLEWDTIFALVGAALIVYYFIILLPPTGNALSMDSSIYLASMFIFGLHLTLNLLFIGSVIYGFNQRKIAWWKHVFNFSIYTLMLIAAHYSFILFGGQIGNIESGYLFAYIISLSIYFVLNVLFIGVYFFLDAKESLFAIFQGAFGETVASYFSTLTLSIVLAVLLKYEHIFGLFLFVSVSLLLSFAFKQYFELYQEVSKKATIDQLTGLINHGAFKEILVEKITDAKSNGEPLCLAMLDLDDFKRFNDYYGHLRGDELLKNFGTMLKEGCREEDIVARYGGEEFGVLLPNMPKYKAYHFLDRLRKKINDTYFEGVEVFPHGCLSFSAGIIQFDNEIYDSSGLIERADNAMYFAKYQGKNNVHLYDGNENSDRQFNNIEKDMEILEQQLKFFLSKDVNTYRHSRRVFEYAIAFKDYLNLSDREKRIFVLGALIHDIGKLEIPREIIQKKGKLTSEEWEIVKKHVTWGKEIVSIHKGLIDIVPLVELHHERYDGKGYPHGLKGEEIPKLARVLCVIDSFDAMTTERPYQETKSFAEAIQELKDCSGNQFDSYYVNEFIHMLNDHFMKNDDDIKESTS